MWNNVLSFLQGASNAAASSVSAPVDLLSMGLRGVGYSVPADRVLGSSEWMRRMGLTAEPGNRIAGLLGEAAGMSAPIAAAAKAPEIARGLLQVADNAMAAPTMGPLRSQRGALYFRNTKGPTPDTGVGYMMFSDDADRVASYGKNSWVFDSDSIPRSELLDAADPKVQRDIARALLKDRDLLRSYGADPRALAKEANPSDIVNSAGLWDAPDLVGALWRNLLEERGARAVITRNGAIVFDPSVVRPVK